MPTQQDLLKSAKKIDDRLNNSKAVIKTHTKSQKIKAAEKVENRRQASAATAQ